MPFVKTKRARGGAATTLATGASASIQIPNYANEIDITAGGIRGCRVLVQNSNIAPALSATAYGYITPNANFNIILSPGRNDGYLILYNDSGSSTTFYITYYV